MTPAPGTIVPKISRLVRLMGTESDGEALGAVRALNRTLIGAGHDFHWLADRIQDGFEKPARAKRSDEVTSWDDMPIAVRLGWLSAGSRSWMCTDWERDFCTSLRQQMAHFPNRAASAKQRVVASRIVAKLWIAGERP